MKRILLLVLFAVCALSLAAWAQEDQGGPRGGRGGRHMPSVDEQVSNLKQAVNLTDDQAAKVHDILQAQHEKMQQMMQDSSMSREDRHAKMQQMREDTHQQIRGLLNDDQKKSFDAYVQQQQNQRGNWRRGGPDQGSSPQ